MFCECSHKIITSNYKLESWVFLLVGGKCCMTYCIRVFLVLFFIVIAVVAFSLEVNLSCKQRKVNLFKKKYIYHRIWLQCLTFRCHAFNHNFQTIFLKFHCRLRDCPKATCGLEITVLHHILQMTVVQT